MQNIAGTVVNRHNRLVQITSVLAQSLRSHLIFFVIPICYIATNAYLFRDIGEYRIASIDWLVMGMLKVTLPAGLVIVFVFRLLQYAIIIRPPSTRRAMMADLAGLVRNPSALILGLPMLAAMVLYNKGVLELKPAIPKVNPFSWDVTFMELDRLLHFGFDPWRLLQPVLGYDIVTFALSIAYACWFILLFGSFVWFGFSREYTPIRTQFFLSYMLTWWIGGGILAVAFSSAGPVYYGGLGLTPNPFAELMAYLYDVDTRWTISALDLQELLWNGYMGKGPVMGISAFPSMHNAKMLLLTLAIWHNSRKFGMALAVYTFIILLGSVHLGWHYAIDGYAGLAIAGVCWWIAGYVARWHHSQESTKRLSAGLARFPA